MKKKIVSLALVVALIAIAAMGTLAYFTDEDAETNTFTVGNVSIDLIESQLHRTNAGVANGQTSDSELWSNKATDVDAADITYDYCPEEGKTYGTGGCYSDEVIQADAETYQSVYLREADIAPGTGYHKMPYVINTGKNDAYIRIRVIIPTQLDEALLPSMYTQSAMDSGEFTFVDRVEDGNKVYEFTRVHPLAAGEMTFWNVWGSIHMDPDVTNKDIDDLIEAGLIDAETGAFDVLVEADAIQADGFASAEEAWTAYAAA